MHATQNRFEAVTWPGLGLAHTDVLRKSKPDEEWRAKMNGREGLNSNSNSLIKRFEVALI